MSCPKKLKTEGKRRPTVASTDQRDTKDGEGAESRQTEGGSSAKGGSRPKGGREARRGVEGTAETATKPGPQTMTLNVLVIFQLRLS